MNKYLATLGFALLSGSVIQASAADLATLEQRLQAQEQRIQQLEQQSANNHSISNADIRISGFINAVGQSTNLSHNGPSYYGADHNLSFTEFSSAGLQVEAEANDKVSGTIQLYADGGENFDAKMEWGYLSYQATDNLKLRAGRMVAPFFMHSQYYRVGYAYPWVELPVEVYEQAPVRTFDGVDFILQFNTGNVAHSLNMYYGSASLPLDVFGITSAYTLDKQAGANLTSSIGNWSTWLSYNVSESSYTLPDLTPAGGPNLGPYSQTHADGYFASVGLQYDNGRFIFMTEQSQLNIMDTDWIPKSRAGYTLFGFRAGMFTPHVTWAYSEDLDFKEDVLKNPNDALEAYKEAGITAGYPPFDPAEEALYQASGERHQKSWTLGVRADVAANLSVKVSATRYYDIGNRENIYDSQAAAKLTGNPVPLMVPGPGNFDAPNNQFLLKEDRPMVFRVSANYVF